jgi:hypothetical protein
MAGFFDNFFGANPHTPVGGVGPMPQQAGATPMLSPQQSQQAQFAMSLMNQGQPQSSAPQMQPMQNMQPTAAGQQAAQFLQQYAPMGGMQQQNDEMMRQRMQGLMAMLGGQS